VVSRVGSRVEIHFDISSWSVSLISQPILHIFVGPMGRPIDLSSHSHI